MSAAIERIRSSVDSLNRVHANGEYAASCAIGVWTDDRKRLMSAKSHTS